MSQLRRCTNLIRLPKLMAQPPGSAQGEVCLNHGAGVGIVITDAHRSRLNTHQTHRFNRDFNPATTPIFKEIRYRTANFNKFLDEILSGATLALLMHLPGGDKLQGSQLFNPYLLMVLLIAASDDRLPWMNYARPYIAASLVGCTLVRERGISSQALWPCSRFAILRRYPMHFM